MLLVLENPKTAIYAPRTSVQYVEDTINLIGRYARFSHMIASCHGTLVKRFQTYTTAQYPTHNYQA